MSVKCYLECDECGLMEPIAMMNPTGSAFPAIVERRGWKIRIDGSFVCPKCKTKEVHDE